MKRNSTELKVKYHGNKKKKSRGRKKNPNMASVSKLGYRDDSPYRSLPYIDIDTPSGRIDMSNTGIPLWANGRILPPYSGIHQFDTTQVKEIPLAQKGRQTRKLQPWEYVDKEGKIWNDMAKIPLDPQGRTKYAESLDWMKNWISQRKPQMLSLMKGHMAEMDEKHPVDAWARKYIYSPLFGKASAYKLTDEWGEDDLGKLVNQKLNKAIGNINTVQFVDDSKIAGDTYTSGLGSYSPYSHRIKFSWPDENVQVHEIGHSSKLEEEPVVRSFIRRTIENDPVYKKNRDPYYHDPGEIYSRIWELRRGLNIKPNEKITKESLKKKLEKEKDRYDIDEYINIFRHLDTDTIINLLNGLVYQENTSKEEIPLAQKGLIVNDPNDPRLKAYQDSSRLNAMYPEVKGYWKPNEMVPEYFNKLTKKYSKGKIKPVGVDPYKVDSEDLHLPVFKKPVEIVTYQPLPSVAESTSSAKPVIVPPTVDEIMMPSGQMISRKEFIKRYGQAAWDRATNQGRYKKQGGSLPLAQDGQEVYNMERAKQLYTPDGTIDMSATGIPLWANGQLLQPYSGQHFIGAEQVKEIPAKQTALAKKGTQVDSTIPVIDDAGSMVDGMVWVPDWKKMAEQAKKLGAKKVRTKSGAIINFDNNWEVVSVDDNPGYETGGPLPKHQLAPGEINYNKPVSELDSIKNMAYKTMLYELERGSSSGTGLSDFGNPNLPPGANIDDAVNWYMKNTMSKLEPGAFNTAMEKAEAGDFIYNTGRDPRIYMLDQYLKSTGQPGLPNRSTFNIDMNKNPQDWANKKPELDALWKQYYPAISKLSTNSRRILLNKGRDWYYQNIERGPGSINEDLKAYKKTWYGRIWNTNDYEPYKEKNPKFTPKSEKTGGSTNWLQQFQTTGQVSGAPNIARQVQDFKANQNIINKNNPLNTGAVSDNTRTTIGNIKGHAPKEASLSVRKDIVDPALSALSYAKYVPLPGAAAVGAAADVASLGLAAYDVYSDVSSGNTGYGTAANASKIAGKLLKGSSNPLASGVGTALSYFNKGNAAVKAGKQFSEGNYIGAALSAGKVAKRTGGTAGWLDQYQTGREVSIYPNLYDTPNRITFPITGGWDFSTKGIDNRFALTGYEREGFGKRLSPFVDLGIGTASAPESYGYGTYDSQTNASESVSPMGLGLFGKVGVKPSFAVGKSWINPRTGKQKYNTSFFIEPSVYADVNAGKVLAKDQQAYTEALDAAKNPTTVMTDPNEKLLTQPWYASINPGARVDLSKTGRIGNIDTKGSLGVMYDQRGPGVVGSFKGESFDGAVPFTFSLEAGYQPGEKGRGFFGGPTVQIPIGEGWNKVKRKKQKASSPRVLSPRLKQGGWLDQYQTGKEKLGLNNMNIAVPSTTSVRRPVIVPMGEPPLPEVFEIVDERDVHPVTGKKIDPKRDLKGGRYDTAVIRSIAEQSKKYGLNQDQALDLMGIAFQETMLGKTDNEIGHALHGDPISGTINKTQVFSPLTEEEANSMSERDMAIRKMIMNYVYNTTIVNKHISDRARRLQYYNTPYPKKGSVRPSTEEEYHGGKSKAFYSVPVTEDKPLSMDTNPYGLTVGSLINDLLSNNPVVKEVFKRTYKKKTGGPLPMAQTGIPRKEVKFQGPGGTFYYDSEGKMISQAVYDQLMRQYRESPQYEKDQFKEILKNETFEEQKAREMGYSPGLAFGLMIEGSNKKMRDSYGPTSNEGVNKFAYTEAPLKDYNPYVDRVANLEGWESLKTYIPDIPRSVMAGEWEKHMYGDKRPYWATLTESSRYIPQRGQMVNQAFGFMFDDYEDPLMSNPIVDKLIRVNKGAVAEFPGDQATYMGHPFDIPNPKYDPQYKIDRWDKVRATRDQQIRYGIDPYTGESASYYPPHYGLTPPKEYEYLIKQPGDIQHPLLKKTGGSKLPVHLPEAYKTGGWLKEFQGTRSSSSVSDQTQRTAAASGALTREQLEKRIALDQMMAEKQRRERQGIIYSTPDPGMAQKKSFGLAMGMPSSQAAYLGTTGTAPALWAPVMVGSHMLYQPISGAVNVGMGVNALSDTPEDLQSVIEDPSFENAFNLGLDILFARSGFKQGKKMWNSVDLPKREVALPKNKKGGWLNGFA